jgi:hypothetical protein
LELFNKAQIETALTAARRAVVATGEHIALFESSLGLPEASTDAVRCHAKSPSTEGLFLFCWIWAISLRPVCFRFGQRR